jgi:hypothetical protein
VTGIRTTSRWRAAEAHSNCQQHGNYSSVLTVLVLREVRCDHDIMTCDPKPSISGPVPPGPEHAWRINSDLITLLRRSSLAQPAPQFRAQHVDKMLRCRCATPTFAKAGLGQPQQLDLKNLQRLVKQCQTPSGLDSDGNDRAHTSHRRVLEYLDYQTQPEYDTNAGNSRAAHCPPGVDCVCIKQDCRESRMNLPCRGANAGK